MHALMYNTTGQVVGSQELPDGFELSPGFIECTPEQAAGFSGHKVDLSGDAPVIVDLPLEDQVKLLQVTLTSVVQAILDAKAQSYHYDNLTTAVTYAEEPSVPKFQEEGQAFRAWRSQVWASAYSILAEVQAGTRAFPTLAEVPSLLPPFPLD